MLLLVTAASMAYAFAEFYRGGVNYHSTREGDNVRALCRALCRVCLSWDSTHPSNNINDNGAATTNRVVTFFRGPLYLSSPPQRPFKLKKKDIFPTLLSLSL